jgi:hypothetical protein
METLLVLVKAGADVHCKDKDGYSFSRLHPDVVGLPRSRGGRSVDSGVELQERLF